MKGAWPEYSKLHLAEWRVEGIEVVAWDAA
jgi:hypothetical protein